MKALDCHSVFTRRSYCDVSQLFPTHFIRNMSENSVLKECFKNGILSFATTWIDFRDILLCEINQTEKNKYYMISFVCGI